MIEIRTKLRASALALALAGFTTIGCVDNSGNKTYPRSDAGADLPAAEDTASDTPVTSDVPAADTAGPGDTATDRADTAATSGDTATDRADTATSGDAADAQAIDVRADVPPG